MTSLEANLYLAAFPKSSTHEKTWELIWNCCHGPSQPLEKASAQRSMKMGNLGKRTLMLGHEGYAPHSKGLESPDLVHNR